MSNVIRLKSDKDKRILELADKRGVTPDELARRVVADYIDQAWSRQAAIDSYNLLTPRQQELVWLLYWLRLATRRQLGTAVSQYPYRESDAIYAKRCLNVLIAEGLVEGLQVRGRALYTLTDRGTYVCEYCRGRNPKKVRSPYPGKLLLPHWLRHHLEVTDVAACFFSAQRRGYGEQYEWDGDGEVQYRFNFATARRRLIPDGRGLWVDDLGVYPFHVELHGASDTAELAEKIRKYAGFILSGAYVRETLTPPPVLIVTRRYQPETAAKAVVYGVLRSRATIADAVRQGVCFAVTHLDELRKRGPFEPIWDLSLEGARVSFGEICRMVDERCSAAGRIP